jgi:hypothetical protein
VLLRKEQSCLLRSSNVHRVFFEEGGRGVWWSTNSVEDRQNVNMRQYLPVQGSTEYANE